MKAPSSVMKQLPEVKRAIVYSPDMETGQVAGTGRVTGRVEILRPAGQAGWYTGQILLSCN